MRNIAIGVVIGCMIGATATAGSSGGAAPSPVVASVLPMIPMQSGCNDDSVDTVSEDGTILKTLYGHVYDIFDGATDVSLWLSSDDLLVCPTSRPGVYRIINTDENNEIAYGTRLR